MSPAPGTTRVRGRSPKVQIAHSPDQGVVSRILLELFIHRLRRRAKPIRAAAAAAALVAGSGTAEKDTSSKRHGPDPL